MDIGRLNKRITIEHQASTYDQIDPWNQFETVWSEESYDDAGQQVESWSTFATVWADIKHNSGIETIKSDALASSVKTSIRVRYMPGVNAGMRVNYSGLQYEITAVLPHVNEKRYIDLICRLINGSSP